MAEQAAGTSGTGTKTKKYTHEIIRDVSKDIPGPFRMLVTPVPVMHSHEFITDYHFDETDSPELPQGLLKSIQDQAAEMNIEVDEEVVSRPSHSSPFRVVPSNPDEENVYEYTDPYQRLAVAMIKRAVDAIRNKENDAYAALDWILGEGTQYNRITFEDLCDVLNCKAEYIRSEICRRV